LSGWIEPGRVPPAEYRARPRIAGIGVRLGAWLIDVAILGFAWFIWLAMAGLAGAVRLNPDAQQQLNASPFNLPTATPFETNLPLLAALGTVFVLFCVIYAAVFWGWRRGTPGQLLLSVEVADAESGRNLNLRQSFMRSIIGIGIPCAWLTVSTVGTLAVASSASWSEVVNPGAGGETSQWAAVPDIGLLVVAVWLTILLVTTVGGEYRRGLHDRIAGSIVVTRRMLPARPPAGPWSTTPPQWPAAPAGWPGASGGGAQPTTVDGTPEDGTQPPVAVPPDAGSAPAQPAWLDDSTGSVPVWIRAADESDLPVRFPAARPGRRLTAYLIDCGTLLLIILTSVSVLFTLFAPVQGASADASSSTIDDRTFMLIGLFAGMVQAIYFVAGWVLWRGTVGQRLLGMEVTNAETSKPLTWTDAFVRWAVMQGPLALAFAVPPAVSAYVLLGAFMWEGYLLYTLYSSKDWHTPHDRFVNSRVAQER